MYSVRKSPYNPILSPDKDHLWEELSTCNGSPVKVDDLIYLVYRAIADPYKIGNAPGLTKSSIGLTWSKNGRDFIDRVQFIKPEESWEEFGCEDPRITKFENKYYIFYTALSTYPLSADGIKVGLAISDDLKTIKEKHSITPFNAKAMVLFPERINGKIYAMLSVNTDRPPAEIAIREFDSVEEIWDKGKWEKWYSELDKHKLRVREKDTDHVEVGAVPIKTKHGWLLIYSYIQDYFASNKVFGIEALLLDLDDPKKIIGETESPILIPEEIYERYGYVPTITFPSGALLNEDELEIYYGASDTTTCKASLNVEHLIRAMLSKTRYKDVIRNPKNPLLSPTPNTWENRSVFNPAAIDLDGTIHLLYRAMSKNGTSFIGYATTKDGINIDYRSKEPIYIPKESFELKKGDSNGNSGSEDPRLTLMGNKIYMCYTAYDGVIAPKVAMTSISKKDFLNGKESGKWKWERSILLTPEGIDDKDACIFPEKIEGKFGLMHRVSHTICLDFLYDLNEKNKVTKCISILEPRPGMWDSRKIGISSPPHKTKKGWLLFYHGICRDGKYKVGAALLDLKDPTHVLSRTAEAIFEPEEEYELNGEVNNVVFPCGSVIRGDKIYIYYGASDKYVCGAETSLNYLLKILDN